MPVTPPAVIFKLDQHCLTQLALQVAMHIAPIELICQEAGITVDYYEKDVKTNEFYSKVLEGYIVEWNSVKNTPERVKWKAQALTELALPTLGARMLNANETLPAVTETAKLISRLGGVDSEKNAPGAGEKFTITINLGPDKTVTYEKTADDKTIEGHAVRQLSQGEGTPAALQTDGSTQGNPTKVQVVP